MEDFIPVDVILEKILTIRGIRVMLDKDLAALYDVPTRTLKQAVRRNLKRFPSDFMFELTYQELKILRSQSATSRWGGDRYPPMAFTEQGLAMLSSVLNSDRAINGNIQIMRAFVRMRQLIFGNLEIKKMVEELKTQTEERFQIVFEVLDSLITAPEPTKREIGYTSKK